MICFVDIDDVLADFTEGLFRALGIQYSSDHPALVCWEWWQYFGLSYEEFDAQCNIHFWEGLRWTPDGREIFGLIKEKFSEIYLLTCPMPNPDSATGKTLWVKRHLPHYVDKLIISSAPKRIFAGNGRVLIDDHAKNCAEFSKAGGEAILVPRPYNVRAKEKVIPSIIQQLVYAKRERSYESEKLY